MISTGLYIHIPFCSRRCGYCDFNTFAGQSHLIPNYVKALCQEISTFSDHDQKRHSIDSIYFGGGTPSLLRSDQFEKILNTVRKGFPLEDGAELTLEANPGTVDADALSELRALGFNRISFGMQSAHPGDLAVLNRKHEYADVIHAVEWSRNGGFEHINVDLIFGIPGQTLERWQQSLTLAAGLGVDHLSLYSLTIEEGTPLEGWYNRGLLEPLEDDLTADMFEYAMKFLSTKGFGHYEISNWAKVWADGRDSRCRHNLNTWRFHPYFGAGAGAHGFIGEERTANVRSIPEYIRRMENPAGVWPVAEAVERLSRWDQIQEWMMVGLRRVDEGVSPANFEGRFGFEMDRVFGEQIHRLTEEGLLEKVFDNDRLRLTHRGIMLGNQVFLEFVGNPKPDFIPGQ